MMLRINESWAAKLKEEMGHSYFVDLMNFVEKEYTTNTCYPPLELVYSCLDYTSFKDVKVVILGQDPYHGPNQANGLCFSVNPDCAIPPSLKNIFKEIENDIGISKTNSGDLSSWAKQGVLLLNASLTVRAHQAGSHQKKGWEKFTDAIISKISKEKKGIVFLLWGGFAKKKVKLIDNSKHIILTSGHPSPLSANRGYWFGNKHFSTTNDYLIDIGLKPILW